MAKIGRKSLGYRCPRPFGLAFGARFEPVFYFLYAVSREDQMKLILGVSAVLGLWVKVESKVR